MVSNNIDIPRVSNEYGLMASIFKVIGVCLSDKDFIISNAYAIADAKDTLYSDS